MKLAAEPSSTKTFLSKKYSQNVSRLIKADSGLLDYADARHNLSDQNTSMRRLGVSLYPPGFGADSGSRNQDTPDSSRGIGEIDDSRTIDRPSISTRPLTKTLGLFRPSINEVRALMMYPTPLSRADRDGTPTMQHMNDNEDKQLIVRNRILANLIKGTEAVKKVNLAQKQQHLGLSNPELGRLSKSGLGIPTLGSHLTPPTIEIFKAGSNGVTTPLFFAIPQSKSPKVGFDFKLFEQVIIKVGCHLTQELKQFAKILKQLEHMMKTGMTKYAYSESHIFKLTTIMQEMLLLCRAAKLQAVYAEMRQKPSIFEEENQRHVPHIAVKSMLDKSGKCPSLQFSGWEESLSVILQFVRFTTKHTFKFSNGSLEPSARANLVVTPAHKFVMGLLLPLDQICRDLHLLFSGHEISLASVMQEVLSALQPTIKMPAIEQSTNNSRMILSRIQTRPTGCYLLCRV